MLHTKTTKIAQDLSRIRQGLIVMEHATGKEEEWIIDVANLEKIKRNDVRERRTRRRRQVARKTFTGGGEEDPAIAAGENHSPTAAE